MLHISSAVDLPALPKYCLHKIWLFFNLHPYSTP